MKLLIIIGSLISIILIGYNITLIDYSAPFENDSIVAFITILASLCALLLLQILRISKKIEAKTKGK